MVHELVSLLADRMLAKRFRDDGIHATRDHWVLCWRGGRDKCDSIVERLVVGYWGHGEEGVAMVPVD
jgi:hypothetical protein